MAASFNLSLEEKESKTTEFLQLMKTSENTRLFIRYQAIYLLLLGKTHQEVALIIGKGVATIYNYARSFREGGIDGLLMDYSPGRPRKLSEDEEETLYETITTKSPDESGFRGIFNWTAPLIRKWANNEFKTDYTDRGMREVLYRLNLSFTMPTYHLEKADVEAQIDFLEDFEEVKKNS